MTVHKGEGGSDPGVEVTHSPNKVHGPERRPAPGAVCCANDLALGYNHSHGGTCCKPHQVMGPATGASGNVFIGNQPVMRMGDTGVHGGGGNTCCGLNTYEAIQGSGTVTVNGFPVVRVGDLTSHCAGTSKGEMITGSKSVNIGGPAIKKSEFEKR